MPTLKYLGLVFALFVCALTGSVTRAQTPYSITVQAGPLRQTFDGFGASQTLSPVNIWNDIPATPRAQMTDLVYRDLKLNTLRLWIECDGHTDSNGLKQTPADLLAQFHSRYIATGVLSEIASRGTYKLLISPTRRAPYYMWNTPLNEPVSDYTIRLAEFILQLKNTYGVTIHYTGIANEPSQWTTTQIVDCVKQLRTELNSRSLQNVKIVVPESAFPDHAVTSLDAVAADPVAWSATDIVASHSYGSTLNNSNMMAAKRDRPWWTTEGASAGAEVAEDENSAATVLARFLCELNHGVSLWIYFIGQGKVPSAYPNIASYPGGSSFLVLYEPSTGTVLPFLKYYYIKQALHTFDVGSVFRKCVSAAEGEMLTTVAGTVKTNPAINAAAAINPDGSWAISIVNDTGITGANATAENVFKPAASYNVTITVQELATTPSKSFTVYRSRANNHFVNSGTVTLINGVGSVTVAAKELVSLRSAAVPAAIPPVPNGLVATVVNAPVSLVWNNTAQATGWKVKRATVSGGPYTVIGTTTKTEFDDLTAVEGTMYYYVVSATNGSGESANSGETSATPTPFPWFNQDVGAVGVTGAYKVSDDGVFTTKGAGSHVGQSVDSYNLTYRMMKGDGSLIARMASVDLANVPNAKIGIMMIDSLGVCPFGAFMIHDFNANFKKARFGYRYNAGWGATFVESSINAVPVWFKLTRAGNLFSGYASTDGISWTLISSVTIAGMPETLYAGLVNCSRNTSALCTAIFDNVQATPVAPTGLTQYASPGSIKIGWTASSSATSYNVKRATSAAGPYTLQGTVSGISYTDTTAIAGTNYYYQVSAVNAIGEGPSSAVYTAWQNIDIGVVGVSGSVLAANGSFATQGGGSHIGQPVDSFNFTYRMMTGDGTFIARLANINLINVQNAKAGILMMDSLGTSPLMAGVIYDFNANYVKARFCYRYILGWGATFEDSTITTVPTWFKLTRVGNVFTGYASADGVNWTLIKSTTITMPSTIYLGLANCSRNTAYRCSATFDNVIAP